jgi:DNA-binding Lrp family transcriptional regulator
MLDDLDRGLVHALQIDGRAPFSRLATVLGTSTQTVARRYRRLRVEAGLRVVGLADPAVAGRARWLVRIGAVPHATRDLARALARRSDTTWVKLTSGGTGIIAVVTAPPTESGPAAGHGLLLHDLPRTAGITEVTAHYLLHTYLGGPTPWRGRAQTLTAGQRAALSAGADEPSAGPAEPVRPLGPADGPLLDALARDGRATQAELAAATGWTSATAARRLAELRSSGAIFLDVEISPALLGAGTQALLWMGVAPARLERTALALAEHDELAFVAATTGPTNLVAHALCAGPGELHHYLTRRLGALEDIRTLETAPVLRTLKSAGPLPASPPGASDRAPR